jgi:serine/threonine protein kinase
MCRSCAPLEEQYARHLICQLVSALEYLHFQKVIHRDIKPGNLLVTKEGSLKVADFGVSYMYDGDDDTVKSTAGTSAFLAPEVCSGQGASGKVGCGNARPCVDVW